MSGVLTVADTGYEPLAALLARYGLTLVVEADDAAITGSFWGDAEAGVVGHSVFVRADTPVHSFLHESCHVICMDGARRNGLDRDAGGDDLEEAAVCYLQLVLADCIEGVGQDRLMADMDAWGYSFRLGNSRAWFDKDAEDARKFLVNHGLIDASGAPTFNLRP
ncbi:MAG: hypothetical protein OEY37_04185 [Gammaproteobacteria bacterium]|nr:hypothetical protein [Gammaproteobacteria bacterium]MDH5618781.1 hypothetical protein [Gammaproteobacteria bacterium]